MKIETKKYARSCKKTGKSIKDAIYLDRFSSPVKLNVHGETEFKSGPGSVVTYLFFIVLAAYAGQKF